MKSTDINISPDEFEQQVKSWIEAAAETPVTFEVVHKEMVPGDGGEYEIDVVVRFSHFGGAEFTVLVECKRHKNAIKRELVMVLESKLRDTKAQKGMLFSTSNFQSGAIKFADKHNIALIQVASESTHYLTRSQPGIASLDHGNWGYVGWLHKAADVNYKRTVVSTSETDALRNWLASNG
ncbi:hypothetical protein MNBD_BACTEROID05-786 [hydrothermal vent metagenome]|uniref:Restriction endonuclease type IV Mrr domain-containing protein n=1 Tax=hydrothermal vent metagenome TaxID=652676 RepID=A0A3B0TWQ0_9ZZZZ